MNGPSLVIGTDPPLRLLSLGDSGPGLNSPLIVGTGAIRRTADGQESASVAVNLENAKGQATRLLSVPPLGARAVLYGPNGEEWFAGTLAQVTLGESAALTLEA